MNKLNTLLLVLALASGLAVVTVQERSREYYSALNRAQQEETTLEDDFSRLKLEQAKLANHQLIQQAATQQRLQPPDLAQTKMLTE